MVGEGLMAAGISLLLALGQVPAVGDGAGPPAPPKSRGERLLALHLEDAASYAIYRDPAKAERLELRREPIYRWSNPTRVGGQEGDVFVWTYRGRPEVVASIFSHSLQGRAGRLLCHELHSLSDAVLIVDRDSPNRREPRAPGLDLAPVPGAPEPAASPAQRATQVRAIARDFSGRSRSEAGQAWELRLLPRPLYRSESTDPAVLDGALFALVSDAGTDPEILLLLEARKTAEGVRWVYGAARFSDMNLWLTHKGKDVWSSIRSPTNTFNADAKHRFRFYQDHVVPEIEDGAAKAKAEAK